MKVLSLKLNDKTFMTGKITAYLSKEALKIQKESLALAKKGQALQSCDEENQVDGADELLTAMFDIRERKTWLICEVYQNKFDVETIEKCLDDEEIDKEINRILYGIVGVISKN
jgi:hypothetical protein